MSGLGGEDGNLGVQGAKPPARRLFFGRTGEPARARPDPRRPPPASNSFPPGHDSRRAKPKGIQARHAGREEQQGALRHAAGADSLGVQHAGDAVVGCSGVAAGRRGQPGGRGIRQGPRYTCPTNASRSRWHLAGTRTAPRAGRQRVRRPARGSRPAHREIPADFGTGRRGTGPSATPFEALQNWESGPEMAQ